MTIRVDRTAPSITGPGFGRPPDRNDWFNHPVAFQFTGQDATSGIDSCTGGTYGGSDGAGVSISGSCRDVAGNVTSGAFALNYDATPPPKPTVAVLPGDHRVAISWSSAQNEAEIVRIGKASSQAVVYRGPTESFTDKRLRNGRRYRYVVTLIDQAGNRSSTSMSAVPTDSPLLLPANGAHLKSAPMLAWKRVKHARYYNAQLLRNNRKVLSRWPRTTHLQLHERWRFQGRVHRLVPRALLLARLARLRLALQAELRARARQELFHRHPLKRRLERDVAVLALGRVHALRLQRLERADQLRARLVRDDHVVDVAALGR